MSGKVIYQVDPAALSSVLRERGIEEECIEKLQSLKYTFYFN
jgi:hypothetical protein